jgi:hypothetical protein
VERRHPPGGPADTSDADRGRRGVSAGVLSARRRPHQKPY